MGKYMNSIYKGAARAVHAGIVPLMIFGASILTLESVVGGDASNDPVTTAERFKLLGVGLGFSISALPAFLKLVNYPLLELEGRATKAELKHLIDVKWYKH